MISLKDKIVINGNRISVLKSHEKFPLKQIIFNWKSDFDLKATADITESQSMLNRKPLFQYSFENDCFSNCFNCSNTF